MIVTLGGFNLMGFVPVALSEDSTLTTQAQIAQQRANSVDCGDRYFTSQGERRLHRLVGAIAVSFEEDSGKETVLKDLTALGGLLSEYTSEVNDYGHVAVFKAQPAEESQKLVNAVALTEIAEAVRHVPGLRSASPVFVDPESGFWRIPTGDVVVQLEQDVQPETVFGNREALHVPGTKCQFVLNLGDAPSHDIFAQVNELTATLGVEWAEPGFLAQGIVCALNDEHYDKQWHLNNTGQAGGTINADVDAPEAWTATTGSSNVVIAVLDSGVQTDHPDLRQNLFTNSGDSDTDGIDDDNNGYIDDVHGWDFYTNWFWPNWPNPRLPSYTNGINDPNPKVKLDNHGTSVAGVAVASGNNVIGVAGAAYTSKLLPIRIGESTNVEGKTMIYLTPGMAAAIRYAAGIDEQGDHLWRGADILNCSTGMSSADINIQTALHDAATKGRNGRGCPIFCATGNDASGYRSTGQIGPITGFPGRWAWVVSYEKDNSTDAGEDTVWMAEFQNADGSVYRFDSRDPPPDWSLRPFAEDAGWFIEDDPNHAYGTARYQVRPERIRHGQRAFIRAPALTISSNTIPGIRFMLWRSCDVNDTVSVYLFNHDSSRLYSLDPEVRYSGAVESVSPSVGYPASHPDTIAVGASTNFDYRAHYSQYGAELDFVAPSGGGSAGIWTTDRTGADGYVTDDDYVAVSGTSFSSPLAAGVGALMLSKNPDLTAQQVREIMQNTCDKVGPVPYGPISRRNDHYGYGRINARAALGVEEREEDAVKLLAADGRAGDQFGRSVSVSGDYAVVGAKDSAYLFKREGTNWVQQDKLIPPSQRTYHHDLGRGVSISGNYAVVAAMDTAHVYERSGTDWRQTTMLMAYPYESGDGFASSLSISGDYIMVGAPQRDVRGYNTRGSVFVFRRYGSSWSQHEELTSWDFESDRGFGESVSISADRAIVGIPNGDRDRAYIYERNGQNWERAEKLISPESGTRFGRSVSISGDYAAVRGGSSTYTFKRGYRGWELQDRLMASDFGESIAIGTDYLIIGASNSAYVFKRTGNTWTWTGRLTPPGGETGVGFGNSVSLSGDYAIVGACYDDSKGSNSGAAYIFRLSKIGV